MDDSTAIEELSSCSDLEELAVKIRKQIKQQVDEELANALRQIKDLLREILTESNKKPYDNQRPTA